MMRGFSQRAERAASFDVVSDDKSSASQICDSDVNPAADAQPIQSSTTVPDAQVLASNPEPSQEGAIARRLPARGSTGRFLWSIIFILAVGSLPNALSVFARQWKDFSGTNADASYALVLVTTVWTAWVFTDVYVRWKASMKTAKGYVDQKFDAEGDALAAQGVDTICNIDHFLDAHIMRLFAVGASWFALGAYMIIESWIAGQIMMEIKSTLAIACGLVLMLAATLVNGAPFLDWQPVFRDVTTKYRNAAQGREFQKFFQSLGPKALNIVPSRNAADSAQRE